MSKITDKIKEKVGAIDNLSKFKKFTKLKASYVEYDNFLTPTYMKGTFAITAYTGLMLVEENVCSWKIMVQMY
jgi:hypothetical protein